jgi:DNA polymerase-1
MTAEPRDLFATPETVNKRLVLVDGMALVYRSHFALISNPRFTSSGLCTSAVLGFCNTLLDLLQREDPSHLAVAFDTPEPTHRHELYPQYKAQREEMPEDLSAQLPWIDRFLEAARIQILRVPGWEADDVIGTLARQAEDAGFVTLLVSPDKDYQQLVTEHTFVWKPGRQGSQFEILGVAEVCQRWQVERVSQVIDILGLMGDSSDNVPGVPGIGEKTAQKLIAEFGSVEELLANTAKLTGKRRETVETHADLARLCKQLVTIDTHAPIHYEWEPFVRQPWNEAEMRSLFEELEFRTLAQRVFRADGSGPASGGRASISQATTAGTADQPAPAGNTQLGEAQQGSLFGDVPSERVLQDVPHAYHLVESVEQRRELLAQLMTQKEVCFDIESTSLDARRAVPVGIAFCCRDREASYLRLPAEPRELAGVLEEFLPFWHAKGIAKIGHNLKYDLTVLRWHGIQVQGPLVDTMLAHTLVEPDMKHGMDQLALHYLNYRPIAYKELVGDPATRDIRELPIRQLVDYACEDADVTWQLAAILRPMIEAKQLERVFHEIECPLVRVLVEMEHEGIRLDSQALRVYSEQLQREIDSLRSSIHEAAGHEFNIDSPKQLGTVLYEELRIDDKPSKTRTGQYSTREADLLRLAPRHPIVGQVLDYRNAAKLKSVYVDQLPAAVDERTGRVHTNYSQSWTATGRMQSNDPNLQTIPVRKERGREIRAAFVSRDQGHSLISADYSQIELRIMAALSEDEGMIEAFRSGQDIHAATASKVYKVPIEQVTRRMRDAAKTVNFGILYGISAFGLQQRLNIPRAEAQELISNYFEKYPGVKRYIDQTIDFAREHGYVLTVSGRRRYLRDINSANQTMRQASERLAMNSPIQGSAADLLKVAMVRLHERLTHRSLATRMLLTVHDEIVFDVPDDEVAAVQPLIRETMESAWPLLVPLEVEIGVGKNWLEAH